MRAALGRMPVSILTALALTTTASSSAMLPAAAQQLLARVSSPAGAGMYEVVDPARPSAVPVAHVPDSTRADTVAAVDGAHALLPAWRSRTAGDRADILYRWYAAILDKRESLAAIMTLESGKPLGEARKEVDYAASFVRYYAEEARRVHGEILQAPTADRRLLVLKQPIGVAAAITPWNFPCAMVTRKAAPALAAGCPVVLKPAEATPLTALALEALLLEEAGAPASLLKVVTCSRARAAEVGAALCEDSRVRMLSFTGSTAVGKRLAAQCAPQVKRVALELGGNAPFVVFADADLAVAARALVIGKVRNAGQVCVAPARVLVHESVAADLCERVRALLEQERLGHGLEEGVTIGPLINAAGYDKFKAHVEDCISRGGRLVCGGLDEPAATALRAAGSASEGAGFAAPTLISGVDAGARCWSEETFGPLIPVTTFASDAEALELANDTRAGLAAYFCTSDISRAWRFAEALEAGIVGVNEGIISSEVAPFGGFKESGLGREGGQTPRPRLDTSELATRVGLARAARAASRARLTG